jgi:hypothetical protein
MSSRRLKKIDKTFKKIMGNVEIESNSSNENENENYIETENETVYLDEDAELQKFKHESDFIFERIHNIFLYLQNIVKIIFGVFGIYLLWICLHYFASHLYVKLCVPKTVMGFLLSPFMTATPHCQGLRWVVYNAANMINNMWIVCGTWVCSTLLKINTVVPNDISS